MIPYNKHQRHNFVSVFYGHEYAIIYKLIQPVACTCFLITGYDALDISPVSFPFSKPRTRSFTLKGCHLHALLNYLLSFVAKYSKKHATLPESLISGRRYHRSPNAVKALGVIRSYFTHAVETLPQSYVSSILIWHSSIYLC